MKHIRIAIDGPSGAGKSTLARSIAAKLGYVYVDTGAIYRTISCYVLEQGIDPSDEEAVLAALPQAKVEIRYGEDGLQHRVLVFDERRILLAGDQARDRFHRARPVGGDDDGQIFDRLRLQAHADARHAGRFHLEHA